MTVLRAGDAGRSDGEAMSTGSDLSEEGSDVVFSPSLTGTTIVNGGPSSVDLPGSYDAPLSEILRLHRALAHSYTGPSKQSRRLIKNRPRAYSADFGCLRSLDTFHPPLSGYSPEPTTPTSPTPSDTSSTTSSGTPCGTPKSKTLKFNLATISENLGMLRGPERHENGASTLPRRVRSNSTPLIRPATTYPSDDEDSDDDSDDDNDDYGFLSQYSRMFVTPPNCSGVPTGMHKSKSPTTARRLLPKRWRKPRWASSKTQQVLWTPEGSCTWSSMSGRRVSLLPTCSVHLSNTERLALQKIALAKLQAMNLGCAITIPKDGSSQKRSKRATFSLKRKTNSESSGSGWVFGIPLAKVNAKDLELRRRKPSSLRERRDSLDLAQPHLHTRKSSSSSVSSGRWSPSASRRRNINRLEVARSHSYHAGAMSSDSLSESDSRSTGGTGGPGAAGHAGTDLIDALSLSSSAKLESNWRDRRDSLTPHKPTVPYIVNTCFKYLETYGLHVLGIFRIGTSKKRIKLLRDEFDSGRDVKLNEDHNPHDVGSLLKEFFRDLPDPLLTKDLYNAFLATGKIKEDNRRVAALQLLVVLLPTANRDTLWMLLRFLALVVSHSNDTIDENGQEVPGNKMDSHNLATLFAPNIMHKAKGGEFEVATVERAGDRLDVISVIKEMIDKHKKVFEVTAELHDEVLRLMQETNPEAVDYLLKRKSVDLGIEIDPETSSSFYEESDSSSIPRSPSCSSETDASYPRTLGDALNLQAKSTSAVNRTQGDPRGHGNRPMDRVQSAEPPSHLDLVKVPQFRISSPEQGSWYRPDSRSPSPMSPRISPTPKAMKSATPDLRIRVVPESAGERSSSTSSTHSLISPRPVRFRQQLQLGPLSPSIPRSPAAVSCHTLTVPSFSSLKRDRDSDSNSSLSSYYPSTSRSATNSPITPDAPHSWSMESPPASPMQQGAHPLGGASDRTSAVGVRTSSKQRPLGINVRVTSRKTGSGETPSEGAPDWQKERWKHWEILAKEHSDEFNEHETLV